MNKGSVLSERELHALLPSHWVRVNGCQMHYRAAGSGPQAVVMVHGLTVSGSYLLPTAAELLGDFSLYIPDLPGFGASQKPRRVLTIPDMADTLAAWMDTLGLNQAYLMGNSLGCHTIAALAARHPECVAGIIMISPVGDPASHNTPRLVLRAMNDFVREPASMWSIMVRDFLKVGVRRTLLTLRHLQRSQLDAWLPQVDVPALVVGGGHDRIVPSWWVERVAELLPQGQAAVIGEAGHVPNFSHAAQMARLVRAFVRAEVGP